MLPDGTRPATIHIRDGRIARIGGYDDGAADSTGIDAAVPGSPPGTRRHARPHQRAGPDGVGRLRERDTSGSRRRCHDARGHAAQQPAFDCQRGGVRGQAAGRRRTTPRGRRLLGRRRPRQRDGHSRRWRMGRPRVQEFSCAFGRRGIPARSRRRLAGGASAPRGDWSPSACPRRTTVAPARSETRREPAKLSNLARNATGGERSGRRST